MKIYNQGLKPIADKSVLADPIVWHRQEMKYTGAEIILGDLRLAYLASTVLDQCMEVEL